MRSVRSLVAVAALTCGLGQAAFAADMPAPMTKAPPPAVVAALYNWTGLYVGVNAGYGWSNVRWTGTRNNINGLAVGGQIGANYQVGSFVLGAEALWDWASISGSRNPPGPVVRIGNRVNSVLLATARAGFAWNNVLLYAKGGFAGVNDRARITVPPTARQRRWHGGWTAGLGVEYGFTPNWSLGLEYNYIDTSRRRYFGGVRIDPNMHLVLAKLNYRFNWGR
jgi:outer membrane immunogenic protein